MPFCINENSNGRYFDIGGRWSNMKMKMMLNAKEVLAWLSKFT